MRKKKSVSRNCDNCYCDRSLMGSHDLRSAKLWGEVISKTMVCELQNYGFSFSKL